MTEKIDLIGIYQVDEKKDVFLIELKIRANHKNIDFGKFTQTQEGIDAMNWQSPWDEKFLNSNGTKIIGDWMKSPTDKSDFTRIVFFFHFVNFEKPLITQFGEVHLSNLKKIPERLSIIIEYKEP